jgi:hypothetical protein
MELDEQNYSFHSAMRRSTTGPDSAAEFVSRAKSVTSAPYTVGSQSEVMQFSVQRPLAWCDPGHITGKSVKVLHCVQVNTCCKTFQVPAITRCTPRDLDLEQFAYR